MLDTIFNDVATLESGGIILASSITISASPQCLSGRTFDCNGDDDCNLLHRLMVLKLWLIGVWFVCIFGKKVYFHFAINPWNHNQLKWLLMFTFRLARRCKRFSRNSKAVPNCFPWKKWTDKNLQAYSCMTVHSCVPGMLNNGITDNNRWESSTFSRGCFDLQ